MISGNGGNQLNADLTGDSMDDVMLGYTIASVRFAYAAVNGANISARSSIEGNYADPSFAEGGVGAAFLWIWSGKRHLLESDHLH